MKQLNPYLLFLFVSLAAYSSSASEVNFEQLRHCFSATNFTPESFKPQRYPHSQFVGSVKSGTRSRANVNALVYRSPQANSLMVLQESGSSAYRLQPSAIDRRSCQGERGGVVVPVQAALRSGEDSGAIKTNMRIRISEVRGGQNRLCPIGSVNQQNSLTGLRPQNLTAKQVEVAVQEAILDRLSWIAEHINPQNAVIQIPNNPTTHYRDLMKPALENQGYCFKVLPEFPGLVAARDRVFCQMGETQGRNCQSQGESAAAQERATNR